MKTRVLTILALLCLLAGSAKAQDDGFLGFGDNNSVTSHWSRLGVGGGLNYCGLSSADPDIYPAMDAITGFNVGAIFRYRFLKRDELLDAEDGWLAFQPEIRFSTYGGKYDDQTLKLSYITVPLMLQAYPLDFFFIEAGVVPSLNVSHSPSLMLIGKNEYDLEKLKAHDVMLALGAGLNIGDFSIGARYHLGTSELAPNMKWKNWNLQVGIIYSFRLKKSMDVWDDNL